MSKIAFVFSGQGAQFSGMGKSFYDSVPAVRDLYDAAEEIRPGTMSQSFTGTADELKKTINTQPCLYLASAAAMLALQENGITPITLGKRILRTETAGMTTTAILLYELD